MQICLFDIDGTLLRSGGAGKAAMEAALVETFTVALADEQVSFSGRTDRAIARDLFRVHDVAFSEANFAQFIATYLRLLPAFLERLQGSVCPGVVPLLDELGRHDDLSVGLLTGNLRDGARVKLGHFGLHERFAFGGFGDLHWERDHVAHEALAAVRRHHGPAIAPAQIWVIGDTPLDIRCARAIGAHALAVATGWDSLEVLHAEGPDLLMPDLSDSRPFLERLARACLARPDHA